MRARSGIFDLATGNNAVTGMCWNESRNELWAPTTCEYLDRMGEHWDYVKDKIPRDDED